MERAADHRGTDPAYDEARVTLGAAPVPCFDNFQQLGADAINAAADRGRPRFRDCWCTGIDEFPDQARRLLPSADQYQITKMQEEPAVLIDPGAAAAYPLRG